MKARTPVSNYFKFQYESWLSSLLALGGFLGTRKKFSTNTQPAGWQPTSPLILDIFSQLKQSWGPV